MLVDFTPRDGQQVELRGRVALYEPRGEMQFVVESMRALGAGSLYEQFLRHRVREGDLLIAGLGDPNNHAGRACVAPDLGPAIVKG
jgi:exodeoxyribonuclease VII large subunit